jgi:hypothetical protein
MRLFKGKGKRKASPSPSSSSVEDVSVLNHGRLRNKKVRITSPARVKQTALAKVANKSTSSSSLKGLAGFAALVNNANVTAAQAETNRGLRSSSSRSHGIAGIKPKAEKMVSISILFVRKS